MSEIMKHSVRLAVLVNSKCYLIIKNEEEIIFPYTTPSCHNTHTNHIQHHINSNNNNIHFKGSLPLALKLSLIFEIKSCWAVFFSLSFIVPFKPPYKSIFLWFEISH